MIILIVLAVLILVGVLSCLVLLMGPLNSRIEALDRGNREDFATNRLEVGGAVAGMGRETREELERIRQRLSEVDKAIGEMRSLAIGVSDLKRILTNVRARGMLGELQLERLLEDILVRGQYEKNVAVRRTAERVEFAIRLPGENGNPVWLPIDAKFPTEDYEALRIAQDVGDRIAIDSCGNRLDKRIRQYGREIHDKYIEPPFTTDFGILYLPTEGLYMEVIRRPGLLEGLQREWSITVVGPTTLAGFLNSLQMGFRTLAIQQHSSEVWETLSGIRSEFGKYRDVLQKVMDKLQETERIVESGLVRTRVIEKKLAAVDKAEIDLLS
ncbi:MAG: DNA recombination protein RmuC [Bryobacteraceae bacterium]|nr:DNA recombination protein RmuC [Bryobacteraceae bacterium]